MFVDEEWAIVAASVAAVAGGLLIWNIVLTIRTARTRAMVKRWMGNTGKETYDETLSAIQANLQQLLDNQKHLQQAVRQIEDRLRQMKSRVGVVRYNAFAEAGSALSFSIAVVDECRNGVVLSGIRNREDTHLYAKPLTEGESSYPLTPEEKEAIRLALQQPSPRPTD